MGVLGTLEVQAGVHARFLQHTRQAGYCLLVPAEGIQRKLLGECKLLSRLMIARHMEGRHWILYSIVLFNMMAPTIALMLLSGFARI